MANRSGALWERTYTGKSWGTYWRRRRHPCGIIGNSSPWGCWRDRKVAVNGVYPEKAEADVGRDEKNQKCGTAQETRQRTVYKTLESP